MITPLTRDSPHLFVVIRRGLGSEEKRGKKSDGAGGEGSRFRRISDGLVRTLRKPVSAERRVVSCKEWHRESIGSCYLLAELRERDGCIGMRGE